MNKVINQLITGATVLLVGIIMIFIAGLTVQDKTCDARCATINRSKIYLKEGLEYLSAYEPKKAIEKLKAGIQNIEGHYNEEFIHVDDTSFSIILAESNLSKGNAKLAANLYASVLNSRISMAEYSEQ
ncbi:MAG: hypothetical protein QM500_20910 [Methylococcales bacterium]